MTKHQRSLLALAAVSTLATTALACQELNAPLYFQGDTIEAQGDDDPLPTSGLTLRFRQPTMQEQMKKIGANLVAPDRRSPEYLQKFFSSEIARWAEIIKANGLMLD